MKALGSALLGATLLAAGIVAARRRRRGRGAGLAGRVLLRALRLVAIALVFLGVEPGRKAAVAAAAPGGGGGRGGGGDDGAGGGGGRRSLPVVAADAAERGAKVTPAQEIPKHFDIRRWARGMHLQIRGVEDQWTKIRTAIARAEAGGARGGGKEAAAAALAPEVESLPPSFGQLLPRSGAPGFPTVSAAVAGAALADMEAAGYWDAWLAGFVWRRAPGPPSSALLAAIERHVRIAGALLKAERLTGPVRYIPWLKKSAPPRDYSAEAIPRDFEITFRRVYPFTDAGPWESAATIRLVVVRGGGTGAVLHRRGADLPLAPGAVVQFRRLDAVTAGAHDALLLRHATLGDVELPPGASLGAWTLPTSLAAPARASLAALTHAAAAGDPAALSRLDALLPAAYAAIRAEVAAHPATKGAPALRLLLTLFDE